MQYIPVIGLLVIKVNLRIVGEVKNQIWRLQKCQMI